MHDHLRDLGREIALASLPRRLWSLRENIDGLLLESSVINVRGIRMVCCENNDNDEDDAFGGIGMRRLRLLDTEDSLLERIWRRVEFPNLIWLRWKECPYSSLPSWIPLKNLRVLDVQGRVLETLWDGESQVPLQLWELQIFAPLSKIPMSIGQLKHLEKIVLHYGDDGIMNLKRLPEEFGNLQSLKCLTIRSCLELKSLADSFCNLTQLTDLEIRNCPLQDLPFNKVERHGGTSNSSFDVCMSRLQYLGMQNTEISEVSFTEIVCRNLHHLVISLCYNLVEVGALPNTLVELELWGCSNLRKLQGLCGFAKLQELDIRWCSSLEVVLQNFKSCTFGGALV